MMKAVPSREILAFGPFTLVPAERILLRGDQPVELGSRSLDILIALLTHANEIVGKRELLATVWPDSVVEESSLRFHVANLRKVLGDGIDGARYITTVAGRGYCFVATLGRATEQASTRRDSTESVLQSSLPTRLQRTIGRSQETRWISAQLIEARCVTIVGSGGVGKTTVAIEVGRRLTEAFSGAVVFVDLGALHDPKLIAVTLATMLGLPVQSDDVLPALIAHLRDKRTLLILDTCEHLIDAVATLTTHLLAGAGQLHVLATSREALRIDGERVFKLEPLTYPPEDSVLSAAAVETFDAVQLFIERARANGARLDVDDAQAAIIGGICRRLDGVALAIELAAGRVQTYGLEKTAALLNERLTLQWPGRRTAPARQRTLQATLDWSYELLTDCERSVLRQLTVFVGYFTFEAAMQVVVDSSVDESQVFGAIESLIDKSIVATHPLGGMMRYRLLDTTRAYALQLEADKNERGNLAARHAEYYRRWLEQAGSESPNWSNTAERAPYLSALGNVRTALEWCFSSGGDVHIGVALAAAAAPVFLAISLLTECHRWSVRALASLPETARGGAEEMRLQAALGMSLMFTRDHSDAALGALSRSLEIAETRSDAANQLLLLGPLHMFHFRRGEYKRSLDYAKRTATAAEATGDPAAIALAHCLSGITLHSMGELAAARLELEAALRHEPTLQRSRTLHLGFDYYNWAGMALGRTLWMQGHTQEAIARVRQTIQDAERLGHPVTLTIVLHWAAAVYLWTGDLETAAAHVDWFLARAETHSLGPYLAVAHGLKGELAICRGDAVAGVQMLQGSLAKLHAARYELVTTAFNLALARGLAAIGRTSEALHLIDETLGRVNTNGDLAFLPELLRVKSHVLLASTPPRQAEAQACLAQSIDWSRQRSAQAWELRSTTDLAALLANHGCSEQAQALLLPIVARFAGNSATADLETARQLLATLRP